MTHGNPFQSSKTHCPHGHAYTPENTKLAKSTKPGHFKRQCRACKAAESARSRRAKLVAKALSLQAPADATTGEEPTGTNVPVEKAIGRDQARQARRERARQARDQALDQALRGQRDQADDQAPSPLREKAIAFLEWRDACS